MSIASVTNNFISTVIYTRRYFVIKGLSCNGIELDRSKAMISNNWCNYYNINDVMRPGCYSLVYLDERLDGRTVENLGINIIELPLSDEVTYRLDILQGFNCINCMFFMKEYRGLRDHLLEIYRRLVRG